ncbi:nucleotidyltransferase family protein [Sphingopyxis sp.]|uniref:nucleotidyltransferase family protein n=1 Tax=Sphingopyxis sp. TaxID=1908224 RepID=UPI003D0B82B5
MSAKIESAMVMAAGIGKRMRPLTATRPKPLVRVAGKALIDHSLDRIEAAGIGHVVVNVHYLADALEAHLAAQKRNFTIAVSDERSQLLETGGGMMKALPLLTGDPILIVNSDNIWTDGPQDSIRNLARHWDDAKMDALLLVIRQASASGHGGKGDFHMDPNGQLSRRKVGRVAPFVYTGIQLVSRRLLVDAPDGPFSTNILWDRAIAAGRLYGLSHMGQWFDVGAPAAIAPTEAALTDG